jgi:hypothetical protein
VSEPWTFSGQVAAIGEAGGVITLVDESTFAISGSSGDMVLGGSQGLFVRDTRVLSRLELRVNGARTESLSAVANDPFSATFVSRCRPLPGRADSTLVVFRSRYVGRGMREDIVMRNFGDEPTYCSVELFVQADFANLFAVKEGRIDSDGDLHAEPHDGVLELSYRRGNLSRGIEIHCTPKPGTVGGRRASRYIRLSRGRSSSRATDVVNR